MPTINLAPQHLWLSRIKPKCVNKHILAGKHEAHEDGAVEELESAEAAFFVVLSSFLEVAIDEIVNLLFHFNKK